MITNLTIVGARPQLVKAAVVSKAFREAGSFSEKIIHTGQHFDESMSGIFVDQLEIPTPAYQLNINSLSHGAMTGRMIEEIENILIDEKPGFVLVYGDTNSTLAGAIAAKKLHIPVVHVEAGLRSFDNKMPEEINRILTDRISDILFCPTQNAVNNLQKEGFTNFDCQIFNVGDVMYDAVLLFKQQALADSKIKRKFEDLPEKFALCTVHRAENTDDQGKLREIMSALDEINNHTRVILPIHPRTKKRLEEFGISSKIDFIEPVGYLEMLYLLEKCHLVLTDSGGLQKEAYFLERPCLTLRDTTEWIELVENQVNILVGSNFQRIMDAYNVFIEKKIDFSRSLYGRGNAGQLIAQYLAAY